MSNTTALALRTGYTMYSTNKSSPYSGLLVAMSKCVIWMRCMSNDPVTQWPVRFRQYCPYHDSDYVWASQSSTRSEWTEKNKRSNIDTPPFELIRLINSNRCQIQSCDCGEWLKPSSRAAEMACLVRSSALVPPSARFLSARQDVLRSTRGDLTSTWYCSLVVLGS